MQRVTNEVDITVEQGEKGLVETGDEVFDHLLKTLLFYGDLDLEIRASGDLPHHLWEDTGMVLGREIKSENSGEVARYGSSVVPMDDALVLAAIDISRPYISVELDPEEEEQGFSQALYREFLSGFVRGLEATVHVKQLSGYNSHHLMEAGIKAVGFALQDALKTIEGVKSTKGVLR